MLTISRDTHGRTLNLDSKAASFCQLRREDYRLGCFGQPCSVLRPLLDTAHSYLALLGWYGGIPVDELGEDSSQGLDAQGEGSHIQQQHVGNVTS